MVVSRPIIALAMMLALTGVSAQAQTNVKPGFNLFSAQQDVEIGAQSAQQAEQQLPILNDAQAQAYVDGIGQRLARNAGGPQFQYRFRVINASDINAFALPGGFIYINRGIIENAKNEGEVAGVIAHEIAHVSLRHGTHQASKAYAAQAGLSILGGLLGGKVGGNAASIINAVGGIGLNAVFLKFSRELETQADIRGAQILAATGYTPADMVNFFHTLEQVDKSKKTTWASDHPAPPDRIKRIQQESALLKVPAQPTTNVAELNNVKSRLRNLGSAPTMAQIAQGGGTATTGSTANNSRTRPSGTTSVGSVPAPSTSLKSYTSKSGIYRVAYPSNWRVYEEGSTGVMIAPEGGIAQAGDRTEVVYGAILNHYDPFGAQAQSRMNLRGTPNVYGNDVTIEAATNDLIAQVRQGSPHLGSIRNSTQKFTLDGGNAIATSLRGKNPNTGVQERVTVVTRQLADKHLVYMLFVTPESQAANYSKLMEAMVNSIRVDDNH
jgi:Zn-dependent protease with chaperone function